MLLKKFATTAALVLSLAGSGVGTISALAASNNGDTTWTNTYKFTSQYDHTPARKKMNKTYYYNHTKKLSQSGAYINVWAALYDGRKANGNKGTRRSYAGDVNYLWNNAVETHGSGISVRVDSQAFNDLKASGVWSPDSVH